MTIPEYKSSIPRAAFQHHSKSSSPRARLHRHSKITLQHHSMEITPPEPPQEHSKSSVPEFIKWPHCQVGMYKKAPTYKTDAYTKMLPGGAPTRSPASPAAASLASGIVAGTRDSPEISTGWAKRHLRATARVQEAHKWTTRRAHSSRVREWGGLSRVERQAAENRSRVSQAAM